MKKNFKQYRWYLIVLLCGFSLFFSCTNDLWEYQDNSLHHVKKSKNKNEELTISAAQQWYEANFAPVVTTRSSSNDSTNRMMKPYWEKAKESNRNRYEVVELPIRTKGGHLILDAETAQKCKSGEFSKFIRNTAKIVIERDTQTGRTRSFVMIFVGSYNYLKKTRSMGKNTYLYRQPDFDGSVLFFEINGTFVNGWQYENGKIVATIAPKQKEVTTDSVSVQTRALVEDCEDLCFTYSDEECVEESWAEEDDEYGFSFGTTVSCYPIYYEECTTHCTYYDDGEDEEDDDNWWDDYPSGGSNTKPSGNTDDNKNDKLKNFPAYDLLTEHFRIVAALDASNVYKLIGGLVYENYKNNPSAYSNACALRISYALNLSGDAIPFIAGQTGSGDTNNDGIKEWYFYRVSDMVNYLNNTYGDYQEVSIDEIKGHKGIIGLSDCGWNDATGHLDIWDGNNCIDKMYPNCQTVYFWEID